MESTIDIEMREVLLGYLRIRDFMQQAFQKLHLQSSQNFTVLLLREAPHSSFQPHHIPLMKPVDQPW